MHDATLLNASESPKRMLRMQPRATGRMTVSVMERNIGNGAMSTLMPDAIHVTSSGVMSGARIVETVDMPTEYATSPWHR